MIQRILIFSILVFTFVSCKNDVTPPKAESSNTVAIPDGQVVSNPQYEIVSADKLVVPNTCDFVTKEWINENFQVDDLFNLDIQTGKSPEDETNSSSCFFRWQMGDMANAGFLLQIMTNPVADEFPDYVSSFIKDKKANGSTMADGETSNRFLDFPGFGDNGCYNAELKQFFWSVGNEYVFMLAFNLETNDPEQLVSYGRNVAQKFMEEFNAAL